LKTQFSIGFILLMVSFPALLFAQQNRFDEATDLLEDSQYREALEIYQEIENQGYESGALWLNMGIIYTQLDSPGMAKFYFLRSSTYPETKQLANESLDYVDSRFSRRSAVLPALPWESFFESLNNSIGVRGLFLIGLFFLNTAAALFIASWFYHKQGSLLRNTGTAVIIASALFMIAGGYVDYLNDRFGTGVMVQERTQVYQQPDTESNTVSTAFEGYKVQVDHHKSKGSDGWHYVRLENGLFGWIDGENIRVF